jgi:hypothetical protein
VSISAVNRPEPPTHLTDNQEAEWRAVVDRLPAEWFPPETHALLAQFCRHVTSAQVIFGLIEKLAQSDEFSLILFDRLLRMQERETRAISSLATRLRITNQAWFSRNKRTGPMAPKPWTPLRTYMRKIPMNDEPDLFVALLPEVCNECGQAGQR